MSKATSKFLITVTPAPQADDPRGYRRLRMALKCLGRRFGLRCVDVRAVEQLQPMADGEYSYRFPHDVGGAHEAAIGVSTHDLRDDQR